MTRGRAASPVRIGREEAQALAGITALLAITAAWWALALWPVDPAAAWLVRTRAICFGVAEDGLPDLGGWIGLIGGPLGMAVILEAGWSRGVRGLLLAARRSRVVAGVLGGMAVGCVVLLAAAGWRVREARAAAAAGGGAEGAFSTALAGDAVPATYPRLDRPAPPLVLVSQSGERFDLAELRGRPVLLTFGYAHCVTICPLLVRNAIRARDVLAGDPANGAPSGGDHRVPAVVVVTLDPWRDTPSRLPAMARDWDLPPDAWILGGTIEDVEAALEAWEVPRTRDATTGAVAHPALTYVLDADGRVAFATTGATDDLVAVLNRL